MSPDSKERAPSGRGKAQLAIDWWPDELPIGTGISTHSLITSDGEVTGGTLFSPRVRNKTVFCLMHPRQDLRRHPLIPLLLRGGSAVWAQVSRQVGNDLRLVHEDVLLDVAAGMEFLKSRGFENVILVGHSGGGSLYAYYCEQSLAMPSERFARAPSGTPTSLQDTEMLSPDALVLVAPHPGQGKLLLAMIDPSVVSEDQPLSVDQDLDPYSEKNGFVEPPGETRYSPEFVARYRAAQRNRVSRIDAHARDLIEDRLSAGKKVKSGRADRVDVRRSVFTPVLTTYRTDADLRCVDLSIDPSNRPYGSVISARPWISNYGLAGFGRLATPEAWLSTWSGLASYASLDRSLKGVSLPTMIIEFTGDCSVFPGDIATALSALEGSDGTHVVIEADHFGRPLNGPESGIRAAASRALEWSAERFG